MKKILVVDDEWAMRNLIKMHLSEHYEVIEADNGFDATTELMNLKATLKKFEDINNQEGE